MTIQIKKCCLILFMKLEELYPEMFSGLNEIYPNDDEGLPEYYKGNIFWEYFYKEESWFDDSNVFGNPFEDHHGSASDFDEEPEFHPLKRSNSYEILGIDRGADEDEIKRAFRKRALEVHPDKNGGSHEEFIKVREAYECLIS